MSNGAKDTILVSFVMAVVIIVSTLWDIHNQHLLQEEKADFQADVIALEFPNGILAHGDRIAITTKLNGCDVILTREPGQTYSFSEVNGRKIEAFSAELLSDGPEKHTIHTVLPYVAPRFSQVAGYLASETFPCWNDVRL